jgi:Mn-dependent DtxR family transcriptional regulator
MSSIPIRVKILLFVKSYTDQNGRPPARSDVAKFLGCEVNNVVHHYHKLRDMGLIEMIHGISRGVQLTKKGLMLIK